MLLETVIQLTREDEAVRSKAIDLDKPTQIRIDGSLYRELMRLAAEKRTSVPKVAATILMQGLRRSLGKADRTPAA